MFLANNQRRERKSDDLLHWVELSFSLSQSQYKGDLVLLERTAGAERGLQSTWQKKELHLLHVDSEKDLGVLVDRQLCPDSGSFSGKH